VQHKKANIFKIIFVFSILDHSFCFQMTGLFFLLHAAKAIHFQMDSF